VHANRRIKQQTHHKRRRKGDFKSSPFLKFMFSFSKRRSLRTSGKKSKYFGFQNAFDFLNSPFQVVCMVFKTKLK
jgi:hypothetical protein